MTFIPLNISRKEMSFTCLQFPCGSCLFISKNLETHFFPLSSNVECVQLVWAPPTRRPVATNRTKTYTHKQSKNLYTS